MATKIIHKKSSVTGKVPLAADLEVGELALNLIDKKIYSKQADDTVVEMGQSDIVNVDKIVMDTTAGLTADNPGEITWNSDDGTLDVRLNSNVTLQLGQELVALAYNDEATTITNGAVVSISGAQGQRPAILEASAASHTLSEHTIGIATESIASGETGYITTFGLVRNLDTSAWSEGTVLYLSDSVSGGLTSTKPTSPNHNIVIGWVTRSHASSGSIFVSVKVGNELHELCNVEITSVTDGDVLTYDSGNARWENKAIAITPSQVTGYNQVEIQTGGGSLDLYKTNWVTDASTYNLPLANSVPAGTVIQVEQGETHKAQEPVVSRAGTDLIRYSGGTDTTITMDSSAPELLRFISNGTNEWSI